MNGVDISKWQGGLDLAKIKCDFVIIKATEGGSYTDPNFADFARQAIAYNKPMGFYHFARPDKNADPHVEVMNFYNRIREFVGKAVFVLDWEQNPKQNVRWAKQWLDEIYQLTGVKPMIYMSESVVNQYDWSSVANADYGLWVARYRDYNPDYNYDMSNAGKKPSVKWWKFYAIWQWTSSGRLDGWNANIDCDVFYGDVKAWNAYAGKTAVKSYVVQEGDTLTSISAKVGESVDDIVAKNNLITVGQTLIL